MTYGYTREEALGRDSEELLRTEYPVPRADVQRAVAENDRWAGDLVQTTKDGRRLAMAASLVVLRGESGEMAAVLGVTRDLSERLAHEAERERGRLGERLVRAERLESLGQLAGGIAHDFNNLLAVIGSYATLMSGEFERIAGTTDPAVYRALVEDIGEVSRTINRGRDLTRQLLAFARQDVVAAEPISLNAVVTDLQELLRRTLGEHIVSRRSSSRGSGRSWPTRVSSGRCSSTSP